MKYDGQDFTWAHEILFLYFMHRVTWKVVEADRQAVNL
jgi:hypothetical protein